MDGRMVRSLRTAKTSVMIPMSDVSTGIHVIRIDRGNGNSVVHKAFIH